MALALFDLDNTLLEGDSDYLWGRFLVEHNIVDGDVYERENQRFYDQYKQGTLDIQEFLAFSLAPLAQHSLEQLHAWREQFITQMIEPIMLPAAHQLLNKHRTQNDTLVIITATNRFVTERIADRFGIEHLLATEAEMFDGCYTGRSTDIPCFQEGKVQRLQRWMSENNIGLNDSWFYSDSHNDLPLLEQVTHPIAVDPDDNLRHIAQQRGWPVMSLRG